MLQVLYPEPSSAMCNGNLGQRSWTGRSFQRFVSLHCGRRDPKEGGRSLFIQMYPDVPWQVFASKPNMRFLTFPAMSKTPAIRVAAGCLLASDGSTSTTLKLRSIALRPGCDWPGTCLVMLGKSKTGLQCHMHKQYVSRHSKETIRVPNQYASSTLSWTFA